MLYFALVFFVLAVAAAVMDLANIEFAHGVGPITNFLFLLALAFLIAKVVIRPHLSTPKHSR